MLASEDLQYSFQLTTFKLIQTHSSLTFSAFYKPQLTVECNKKCSWIAPAYKWPAENFLARSGNSWRFCCKDSIFNTAWIIIVEIVQGPNYLTFVVWRSMGRTVVFENYWNILRLKRRRRRKTLFLDRKSYSCARNEGLWMIMMMIFSTVVYFSRIHLLLLQYVRAELISAV